MSKIFNGEPFVLLTHYDLDGVGCALLLEKVAQDQILNMTPTGYNSIEKNVKKFNNNKNLIITDFSPHQNIIDILNEKFENVIIIDHHLSSLEVDFPKHWKTYINMKASGTKLLYLYLKKLGYNLEGTKQFVECVNDYDYVMWENIDHFNDEKQRWMNAIYLNNIFWNLKFFPFNQKFKNFSWTPNLWKKAKDLQNIKEREISEFDNYLIDDFLRIVMAKNYISDISLFYTNEKHFVIMRNKNEMSFRSKFNLKSFYTQLNDIGIPAGGHKNAGGVNLKNTDYAGKEMEVIELFYNFLKENMNGQANK